MAVIVTLGILAVLALIFGAAAAGPAVVVLAGLGLLFAAVEPVLWPRHRRDR